MLHMIYEHQSESKLLTCISHHRLGGHSEIVAEYLKWLGNACLKPRKSSENSWQT